MATNSNLTDITESYDAYIRQKEKYEKEIKKKQKLQKYIDEITYNTSNYWNTNAFDINNIDQLLQEVGLVSEEKIEEEKQQENQQLEVNLNKQEKKMNIVLQYLEQKLDLYDFSIQGIKNIKKIMKFVFQFCLSGQFTQRNTDYEIYTQFADKLYFSQKQNKDIEVQVLKVLCENLNETLKQLFGQEKQVTVCQSYLNSIINNKKYKDIKVDNEDLDCLKFQKSENKSDKMTLVRKLLMIMSFLNNFQIKLLDSYKNGNKNIFKVIGQLYDFKNFQESTQYFIDLMNCERNPEYQSYILNEIITDHIINNYQYYLLKEENRSQEAYNWYLNIYEQITKTAQKSKIGLSITKNVVSDIMIVFKEKMGIQYNIQQHLTFFEDKEQQIHQIFEEKEIYLYEEVNTINHFKISQLVNNLNVQQFRNENSQLLDFEIKIKNLFFDEKNQKFKPYVLTSDLQNILSKNLMDYVSYQYLDIFLEPKTVKKIKNKKDKKKEYEILEIVQPKFQFLQDTIQGQDLSQNKFYLFNEQQFEQVQYYIQQTKQQLEKYQKYKFQWLQNYKNEKQNCLDNFKEQYNSQIIKKISIGYYHYISLLLNDEKQSLTLFMLNERRRKYLQQFSNNKIKILQIINKNEDNQYDIEVKGEIINEKYKNHCKNMYILIKDQEQKVVQIIPNNNIQYEDNNQFKFIVQDQYQQQFDLLKKQKDWEDQLKIEQEQQKNIQLDQESQENQQIIGENIEIKDSQENLQEKNQTFSQEQISDYCSKFTIEYISMQQKSQEQIQEINQIINDIEKYILKKVKREIYPEIIEKSQQQIEKNIVKETEQKQQNEENIEKLSEKNTEKQSNNEHIEKKSEENKEKQNQENIQQQNEENTDKQSEENIEKQSEENIQQDNIQNVEKSEENIEKKNSQQNEDTLEQLRKNILEKVETLLENKSSKTIIHSHQIQYITCSDKFGYDKIKINEDKSYEINCDICSEKYKCKPLGLVEQNSQNQVFCINCQKKQNKTYYHFNHSCYRGLQQIICKDCLEINIKQKDDTIVEDKDKIQEEKIDDNQSDVSDMDSQIFKNNEDNDSCDDDSDGGYFYFDDHGFPNNALKLYGIDEKEFNKLSKNDKIELLIKKKKETETRELSVKLKIQARKEQMAVQDFTSQTKNGISKQLELTIQKLEKDIEKLQKKSQNLILMSYDEDFIKLFSKKMQKRHKQLMKVLNGKKISDIEDECEDSEEDEDNDDEEEEDDESKSGSESQSESENNESVENEDEEEEEEDEENNESDENQSEEAEEEAESVEKDKTENEEEEEVEIDSEKEKENEESQEKENDINEKNKTQNIDQNDQEQNEANIQEQDKISDYDCNDDIESLEDDSENQSEKLNFDQVFKKQFKEMVKYKKFEKQVKKNKKKKENLLFEILDQKTDIKLKELQSQKNNNKVENIGQSSKNIEEKENQEQKEDEEEENEVKKSENEENKKKNEKKDVKMLTKNLKYNQKIEEELNQNMILSIPYLSDNVIEKLIALFYTGESIVNKNINDQKKEDYIEFINIVCYNPFNLSRIGSSLQKILTSEQVFVQENNMFKDYYFSSIQNITNKLDSRFNVYKNILKYFKKMFQIEQNNLRNILLKSGFLCSKVQYVKLFEFKYEMDKNIDKIRYELQEKQEIFKNVKFLQLPSLNIQTYSKNNQFQCSLFDLFEQFMEKNYELMKPSLKHLYFYNQYYDTSFEISNQIIKKKVYELLNGCINELNQKDYINFIDIDNDCQIVQQQVEYQQIFIPYDNLNIQFIKQHFKMYLLTNEEWCYKRFSEFSAEYEQGQLIIDNYCKLNIKNCKSLCQIIQDSTNELIYPVILRFNLFLKQQQKRLKEKHGKNDLQNMDLNNSDHPDYFLQDSYFSIEDYKDILKYIDSLVQEETIKSLILQQYNKDFYDLKEEDVEYTIKQYELAKQIQQEYFKLRKNIILQIGQEIYNGTENLQILSKGIESVFTLLQIQKPKSQNQYSYKQFSHIMLTVVILNDFYNNSINQDNDCIKKRQYTKRKLKVKEDKSDQGEEKETNENQDEQNQDNSLEKNQQKEENQEQLQVEEQKSQENKNEKEKDEEDEIFDLNVPQLSRVITNDPQLLLKKQLDSKKNIILEQTEEKDDEEDDEEEVQLLDLNLKKRFSKIIPDKDHSLETLFKFMVDNCLSVIECFMDSSDFSQKWVGFIKNQSKDMDKIPKKQKFLLMKCIAKTQYNRNDSSYNTDIYIERDCIWQSTIKHFIIIRPCTLTLQSIDIHFGQEEGIDAGGPQREWINLLIKEIFNPDHGLFKLSNNGITFQPNPLSYLIPDHLIHFRIIGRIIAFVLIKDLEVEIDLTKSFLKHILKKDLYISDLDDIDPEQSNHLQWILKNPVEGLGLTFSQDEYILGKTKTFDLIPDGQNIELTEDNKKQFVKLLSSHIMTDTIKEQTEAFIKGFYEIIPYEAIKYLNESDIGLKLAGLKYIDIDDMEKHMTYEGYSKDEEIIKWFWEVVRSWDEEMKSQFLFFVTGAFKVPYGGFKEFSLQLDKDNNNTEGFPTAHTCFRSMDFPQYQSKEDLKKFLEMAITDGSQGFYIG